MVDDHAVVRAGYRMLLKNSPEIEVVGEADNGELACRNYADIRPDVVVMDLSLPGIGGLEAIRRIVSRDPKARVLAFSMHDEPVFVEQALEAGARGYITKSGSPEVLIEAVKQIAAGKRYLDSKLAKRHSLQTPRSQSSPFSQLSVREFEICCLMAEGLNAADIAKRVHLSYKTVANYGTQIKQKLNVDTSAELARLAIRYGVVAV